MRWNEYFFSIIDVIKQKSKDPSTQVGALIVSEENQILSAGYNGFPRGVNDKIESRYERPDKYLWTVHAETNAIYAAANNGIKLSGTKIYMQWHPCAGCAGAIIQAGITKVIIDGAHFSYDKLTAKDERWLKDFEIAKQMFEESGTTIYIIPKMV